MTWIDKIGAFCCKLMGIDYPDSEGFREHHEEFERMPDADFPSQRPATKVWTTRLVFTEYSNGPVITQYVVQMVEPTEGPRQIKFKRGGDRSNKIDRHNMYADILHWKATGMLSKRLEESSLYTEVIAP